jgi:DNA-binding MarR family transcriptional regulator
VIDLDEMLCFDLYAASRAVTALYRPLLAPLGLTYPQYLVLVVLWRDGSVSVKEVGERLQLDYGTLTPLLRRMADNGLITRTRSAEDERSVTIGLTLAGAGLRRRARRIPQQICLALGLPEPDFERLQQTLRAVTAAATAS